MKADLELGRQARLALWIIFLVMGIASMAWVPRIPEIRDAAGLSNGEFGLVFASGTIGSIFGAQLAGRFVHRFGSRPVAYFSTFIMSGGLISLGFSTTAGELILSLITMNFGYVMTDTLVNSQAVVVEKVLRTKCMSSFHAMWSTGAFLATAIGGVLALHISPRANLILAGVFAGTFYFLFTNMLLPPSHDEHAGSADEITAPKIPLFGRSVLPLWAIGIGLTAGLVAEASASDWGALLLRDHMGIGKGLNSSAFASFALAMIVSRFLGDRVLERFGARETVRLGGYIGGIGWGLAIAIAIPLSSHHHIVALIIVNLGFVCAGLGMGPMVPAFILAASRVKGIASPVALARISVIGISGFFIGPSVTGLLAQLSSLSWAMAYPVAMYIFAGFMARSIKNQ